MENLENKNIVEKDEKVVGEQPTNDEVNSDEVTKEVPASVIEQETTPVDCNEVVATAEHESEKMNDENSSVETSHEDVSTDEVAPVAPVSNVREINIETEKVDEPITKVQEVEVRPQADLETNVQESVIKNNETVTIPSTNNNDDIYLNKEEDQINFKKDMNSFKSDMDEFFNESCDKRIQGSTIFCLILMLFPGLSIFGFIGYMCWVKPKGIRLALAILSIFFGLITSVFLWLDEFDVLPLDKNNNCKK